MTPYIVTYTHRRINPLDVRPSDICVQDIAHHLSLINRFNGATRRPISVAQHSVYVSRLCAGTEFEWQALFHDGGEAIVGDMTKWLKESPQMLAFQKAEELAQRAVYQAFECDPEDYEGMPYLMHPLVKAADQLMVRFEAQWSGIEINQPNYGPLTEEELKAVGAWAPWSWQVAERAFMDHYRLIDRRLRESVDPETGTAIRLRAGRTEGAPAIGGVENSAGS